MRQVGDIGLLYVFVAILIYTAVYFARSPWRASVLTRIFAAKNLLMVLLIGQVVLSVFLGVDYWGRDWFRSAGNYLCGTVFLALAYLLWKMQTQDREQLRHDEDDARAEQAERVEADE